MKTKSSTHLKVMTFNLRYATPRDGDNCWENRKEFVADVIRDYAPDVLGVQEANRPQLDDVMKHLTEYSELGVGRDGGTRGEYSAILYRTDRFDLNESGTFWLSETPSKPSRDWGSVCRRICTWAQLTDKKTKQSFVFYNTHLDHRSREAQLKGAQLIMEHAKKRNGKAPIVLTGDFNVLEVDPVIKSLTGTSDASTLRLVDSFRLLHPNETVVGTYHGFTGETGGKRIDYIFVSPGFRPLEAGIVRTSRDGRYPSDHFPVTATLRLEKEGNHE